jgi:hypothetical protein
MKDLEEAGAQELPAPIGEETTNGWTNLTDTGGTIDDKQQIRRAVSMFVMRRRLFCSGLSRIFLQGGRVCTSRHESLP